MPEDGLTESNVAVLADQGRSVQLAVPLARLPRLEGMLADQQGAVTGQVGLSRRAGRILADVRFAATVTLQCQRCLGPMRLDLQGDSQVALVETEEDAAGVPQEFETALAPQGRLQLAGLLEEELLLALPAAPRHAAGQCPAARNESRDGAAPDVQRPFANLGELLARRPKH
jgi:uncharacterized protein